jgi:hypothetical protein
MSLAQQPRPARSVREISRGPERRKRVGVRFDEACAAYLEAPCNLGADLEQKLALDVLGALARMRINSRRKVRALTAVEDDPPCLPRRRTL